MYMYLQLVFAMQIISSDTATHTAELRVAAMMGMPACYRVPREFVV